MSNRVEELESKVKELQAAVNGLTEELVEAKERVRQLEEEVEVDVAAGRRQQLDHQQEADAEGQVEEDKTDDAKGEDDEEKSSGSDIIVA
jgi:predicted transcriptional regulator